MRNSDFMPRNSDFEQRVRRSFARQTAMQTLGIRLTEVQPGRVALRFAHAAALTQQHGFIHAGVLATALDTACGYAAFSLMPADAAVLSVEFKVDLLAPARGAYFRVLGEVVKPGRTLTVCRARVWGFEEESEETIDWDELRPCAQMNGTMMAVRGRSGITD